MGDHVGGDGAEAWRLLGAVLWGRRDRFLAAAMREGLTPPHAFALLRLGDATPPTLRGLARQLHCDASYVTSLADRLEELGLAERRVSPEDRRVKELVLTPLGAGVQARIRGAMLEPPPELLDLPAEDQAALLRVARRLAVAADPGMLAMLGVSPQEAADLRTARG